MKIQLMSKKEIIKKKKRELEQQHIDYSNFTDEEIEYYGCPIYWADKKMHERNKK